uniref:Putative secreted protein n=1 Tax=Ixodes ricinus TaxID=34613 RepID=A0A6B0U773_IXORI
MPRPLLPAGALVPPGSAPAVLRTAPAGLLRLVPGPLRLSVPLFTCCSTTTPGDATLGTRGCWRSLSRRTWWRRICWGTTLRARC